MALTDVSTRPAVTADARARTHRLAIAVYVAATVGFVVSGVGIVWQWETILAWMVGLLVIMSLRPGAPGPYAVIRDWAPVAAFFTAYVLSRGAAETLGMPLQQQSLVDIDEAIGFGTVPTVWLQEVIVREGEAAWWEAVLSLTYLSHFVVPFTIAGVLWWRDRPQWKRWLARLMSVSVIGVIVYVLVPAIPPWYASEQGMIEPVSRDVGRGLGAIGLDAAGALFDWGQASANPFAAMPSLHAAYSLLPLMFFWPRAPGPLRALLVAFPLTMGFTLVLTAEHWVIDIYAGWALTALVCVAWNRRDARRSDTTRGVVVEAAELDGELLAEPAPHVDAHDVRQPEKLGSHQHA